LSLRRNMSRPALMRLREDFEFSRTAPFYVGNALGAFCKGPHSFIFCRPRDEMCN
jgi:hypothetical protein